MLRDLVRGGMIVDDASLVLLINSLNHTVAPTRVGPEAYVRLIAAELDERHFFGLYAKIWLFSKYGTPAELLSLMARTQQLWTADYRLGRLVGGLRPLFVKSPQMDAATRIVALSRNTGARETWRFHQQLSSDPAAFSKMSQALKSPNTSKSTGTTHAKYMLILSALGNRAVARSQRDALVNANKAVWKDFFYRRWARNTLGLRRFP